MKKIRFALLMLPALLLVTGCNGNNNTSDNPQTSDTTSAGRKTVYVSDFTLEKDSFDLEVNGTAQIKATLDPKNASTKGFEYTSSDASVATVSSTGVITAIKAGSAKITVTTKGTKEDGSKVSKEVSVTVKAPAATGLTVGMSTMTIKEGTTGQISWTITPSNADQKVTFATSDATIATVSESGLVAGVKAGSATITLTSNAKDASGKALTTTVAVTIESKNIVHKVEFQNDDGTLLQAIDDITEGTVPEFTADIPSKASDANGIYIFRGFDKEIVPYVAPTDSKTSVVYKAVYETVDCTPRKITLTKETKDGVDSAVVTLTGEAKGITTAEIAGKAYLAFSKKGGDWATTYSDALSPVINADGSWTMQYTIDPGKFSLDTLYMSKYVWNSAEANNPTDVKLLHKAAEKRYRHTAKGEVLEDNKIPDDWDGTFPENYVSAGYINDTTTSQWSDETSRQAYVDAIAAPTWVGLGCTYDEVEDLVINGLHYSFTATDETWGLPSFKIHDSDVVTATSASLVQDATTKNISYRISGTYEGFTDTDKILINADLQHNSNLDGAGWGYPFKATDAHPVIDTPATDTAAGTWHYDIDLSIIDGLTTYTENYSRLTYTTHFTIGKTSGAKAADFKITNFDTTKFVKDGNEYSLIASGDTWNVVSLNITPYVTPIEEVTKLGYEIKNTDKVYFNFAGKVKNTTGAATLNAGNTSTAITLGTDGSFTASVRVDQQTSGETTTGMTPNYGSSYVADDDFDLNITDASGNVHHLAPEEIKDTTDLDEVSLGDYSQSKATNYVFVKKSGHITMTTVASTFTATKVKLTKSADDKAMLYVNGVVLNGAQDTTGLKLTTAGDTASSVDIPASALDSSNHLEFSVDITAFESVNKGNLRMTNASGTYIKTDGRGINWFWMNDWGVVADNDSVTIGNKTYQITNNSGKEALTVTVAA